MSARRFVEVAKAHPKVDAIVSFAGLPNPDKEELNALERAPVIVAETTQPSKLGKFFEQKIVQVAIVPRFIFPAPVRTHPRTTREWFDKYFQIIRLKDSWPMAEP